MKNYLNFRRVQSIHRSLEKFVPIWSAGDCHIISQHIEISDEDLKARIELEDKMFVTKFFSYDSALRLIAYAIVENEKRIAEWVAATPDMLSKSDYTYMRLKIKVPRAYPTGYGYAKGIDRPFLVNSGVVILNRCGKSWSIKTAYPYPCDVYAAAKGRPLWEDDISQRKWSWARSFDWKGDIDLFELDRKKQAEFDKYCHTNKPCL